MSRQEFKHGLARPRGGSEHCSVAQPARGYHNEYLNQSIILNGRVKRIRLSGLNKFVPNLSDYLQKCLTES